MPVAIAVSVVLQMNCFACRSGGLTLIDTVAHGHVRIGTRRLPGGLLRRRGCSEKESNEFGNAESNEKTGSNEDVQFKVRPGGSSNLEPRHDWQRGGSARGQPRRRRKGLDGNSASALGLRPGPLLLAAQRLHRAGFRLAPTNLQLLWWSALGLETTRLGMAPANLQLLWRSALGLETTWLGMAARLGLAPLVARPADPR
jgi:hypothetical protein